MRINLSYRSISYRFMVIFFLLFTCGMFGNAQLRFPGKPFFSGQIKSRIPIIDLPVFNESEFREKIDDGSTLFKADLFSRDFKVSYDMFNSGIQEMNKDGLYIWRIGFYSEGARSIGVTVTHLDIPPSGKIFACSPDGKHWAGAFTQNSCGKNGSLRISPIPGDTVIIELQLPDKDSHRHIFQMGYVSHVLNKPSFDKLLADSISSPSGFCNVDINCPEGDDWQTEKRSVCRILVQKYQVVSPGDTSRWSEVCTGVLVNNAKGDERPFLLTANHCIKNDYEAQNAVFYFGYESPWCDGPDGSNKNSLFGSDLLATSDRVDFTLVELDQDPPSSYNPYFAGWSRSETAPERTVCIHHPRGDVMKIALDNDPPQVSSYGGLDPFSFWWIQKWEIATTENGSSGSPLFNPDHVVIGLLSGGAATCVNPVNDYFYRLADAWENYPDSLNQLKYWLDPAGTNIVSLPGKDPAKQPTTALKIYPNPSSGSFTIELMNRNRMVQIRIFDLSGHTVFSSGKFMYGEIFHLDISWLNQGFYILQVDDGAMIATRKFVITHDKRD